jgi:hypothetical protein
MAQCRARSKRSQQPCRLAAMKGRTTCWPKPNTQTMSRKLPATLYQAKGCSIVMFSGIVNVFLVSDRL